MSTVCCLLGLRHVLGATVGCGIEVGLVALARTSTREGTLALIVAARGRSYGWTSVHGRVSGRVRIAASHGVLILPRVLHAPILIWLLLVVFKGVGIAHVGVALVGARAGC